MRFRTTSRSASLIESRPFETAFCMAASIMLRKMGSSACGSTAQRKAHSRKRVSHGVHKTQVASACDVRTRSSIVTASGAKGTSLFAAVDVAASWIIAWMSDLQVRSERVGARSIATKSARRNRSHTRGCSSTRRTSGAQTHGRSLSGVSRCGAVRLRVDFLMPPGTAAFAFAIENRSG